MNKRKNKGLPAALRTTVLFGLAIGCLGFSAVGSTRAALTYYSETYTAQIDVQSIGVTLLENGDGAGYRDYTHGDNEWNEASGELLAGTLPEGEEWQPGRTYRPITTVFWRRERKRSCLPIPLPSTAVLRTG